MMESEAGKYSAEHIRVREEVNEALKKEFDLLHILITKKWKQPDKLQMKIVCAA